MPRSERCETLVVNDCAVAHTTWIGARDTQTPQNCPPSFVVEVPHGADELVHYDNLRARLKSDLPPELYRFFWANTDTGAFAWGLDVARRVVAADPTRTAAVIRCLIPRTFVDTNRALNAAYGLAATGLTPGIAPYIDHADDRELLTGLHRAYLDHCEQFLRPCLSAGGFALFAHTYGPRTMKIASIDRDIVEKLREQWKSATWPALHIRPEVDLLAHDAEGMLLADRSLLDAATVTLATANFRAETSATYSLHPATVAWRWASEFPRQTLCAEVRRDLLVDNFELLEPMQLDGTKVATFGAAFAGAIGDWLANQLPTQGRG